MKLQYIIIVISKNDGNVLPKEKKNGNVGQFSKTS
jgi:hypothetical protein